ncbi:9162_t:CDS:2, partial [Cetraspora pellucida]
MVDRISEMSDLTLSLDGWTDVSNNSIYAFLLHKFENINEIINIKEFSSIRHTSSNLLVAIINLLQNVSIDFSKIITIVTDNPSQYQNMIKKNLVLVNFFTSSHFWNVKLRKWALENNIKTGLQTFCKTRWYLLSKVCLSVQTYKNGFQTCLEYNNNFPNECPSLLTKIKKIITSDIFAELLFIYKKLKLSEFEDFDYGLIDHAKNIVNFRAKEFDEPIYYLAFFLNPKFPTQISQNLLNYYNNEPPFNLTTLEPRAYWKHISYQAATSILKMISQINLALSIEVPKKNPTKKLVEKDKDIDDLDNYYKELFSSDFTEEDNELEFSHIQEISLESIQNNSESFIEEFINFDIIEELITISDK